MFVGVLPLLSASSDRRAIIGMIFAVASLAMYYEAKPFLRESTNVLAVIAQYATLTTFGTALVIEANIARGMNPFWLGCLLVAVNLAIVSFLAFLNVSRYLHQQRERRGKKALRAQTLEWAVGFSKTKFDTTLDAIALACVGFLVWFSIKRHRSSEKWAASCRLHQHCGWRGGRCCVHSSSTARA
jgi:hypothetical protein